MNEPICATMAKAAITVDMDDSADQVEAVLRLHNVSAVPVVKGRSGVLMGVISTRDLVRAHAEKKDTAALRAWEICSYNPIEVGPDASVEDVARLMVTHAIHHVVVTEHKQIVGMVSSLDFVKRFMAQDLPP